MNARRLVKRVVPQGLFQAVEPYGHLAEAVAYNAINGFPARGMRVIGVTGTNGKTTTSVMIYTMLAQAGYKVGLMSTVGYGVNGDIRPSNTHMTTLPAPLLAARMKWMRRQGVEWLVLETSSHALHQHRVWSVPYTVAVFTNLTPEHLDYHKTFERYRAAKMRLFKLTAANKRGLQAGIVNADDPSCSYFADLVPTAVTYGLKYGELRAEKIHTTAKGSDLTAHYKDSNLKLHLNVPGVFNVYNALAAAGVGAVVGLTDQQIADGLAAFKGVPGRLELIDEGQPFGVYVDFAVTPDALEKALQSLRQMAKGKVRVVFGATGDRDRSKRPAMGEVAAKYADAIYLTDDETYSEDPVAIRKAVYKGIEQGKGVKKTREIPDRREAIIAALSDAKPGDAVLVAGMGHFTTRNMGSKEIPWDERQIARELLRQR